MYEYICICINMYKICVCMYTNKYDRQTDRQTDRKTDRQTDR